MAAILSATVPEPAKTFLAGVTAWMLALRASIKKSISRFVMRPLLVALKWVPPVPRLPRGHE